MIYRCMHPLFNGSIILPFDVQITVVKSYSGMRFLDILRHTNNKYCTSH